MCIRDRRRGRESALPVGDQAQSLPTGQMAPAHKTPPRGGRGGAPDRPPVHKIPRYKTAPAGVKTCLLYTSRCV